jgi:cyclohexanecarboxylate-CoA ligase
VTGWTSADGRENASGSGTAAGADLTSPLAGSDAVRHWAARSPRSLAVVDTSQGHDRTWTWQELSSQADQMAAQLAELGVRPGQAVAMKLPNNGEAVVRALAIIRAGAAVCALSPALGARETRAVLDSVPVRVMFGDPATGPSVEHVFAAGSGHGPAPVAATGRRTGPQGPGGWPAYQPPDLPGWQPARYGQLAFTSGSTGRPKPVWHRVGALDLAVRLTAGRLGLTRSDRVLVPCPLAHHSGFLYGMWLAWAIGAAQIMVGRWDAARSAMALDAHRGTFAQFTPPMLVDLIRLAAAGSRPSASLRCCVVTGAPVPDGLVTQAGQVLGTAVYRAWGSTETCMGTLGAPGDSAADLAATDGRPLDGIRLRVTDRDGRVLNPGEEGQLQVSSPCQFDGYGISPAADGGVFTSDGWYRTSDLAVISESGFLRISGRSTDVINRGGEKIPATLIENLLAGHDAVAEAAVVATPDCRLGERACAFVVPAGGRQVTLHELQRYLEAREVTRHYWPEELCLLPQLPRNEAGKVQKSQLRRTTGRP